MKINGNNFFIEHKNPFSGKPIDPYHLSLAFEFAYEMCLGSGHHRNHRSGGSIHRKPLELFANALQGKLAELCVYAEVKRLSLSVNFPDLSIHGEGVWDDSDLIIDNQKVSVKSMAHFSNLLLLETKDFDKRGGYLPNKGMVYDYTLAVRLKPDVKSIFRKKRILYNETAEKLVLRKLIDKQDWHYDIPGGITHKDFLNIISQNNIMPKGASLNGKLVMDAENYYYELGKCSRLTELIKNRE